MEHDHLQSHITNSEEPKHLAELALPHATQGTTHELETPIGERHTHVMVVKKGRVLAAEG